MLLAYVHNSKLKNADKDGFPILGHIIIVKVRILILASILFQCYSAVVTQ